MSNEPLAYSDENANHPPRDRAPSVLYVNAVPVAARLRAFAKNCVTHGDMTPMGARMLERIADEIEGKQ